MGVKQRISAVVTAGAALAALGVAGAGPAQAAGGSSGCRPYTSPGAYPDLIQLSPCISMSMDGAVNAYGSITSFETDVDVYFQIGWKRIGQTGEPTSFAPAVFAGDTRGVGVPVDGGGGVQAQPGYCYYTREWFTNSGVAYGFAESPGVCF